MKNRTTFFSYILVLLMSIGCSTSKKSSKNSSEVTQQTFVLVHSAWLGAWQWEGVAKILKEKGHTVITPDLPGHGSDKTSPAGITMDDYIRTITDILDKQEKPVILVGHSFNGITVSRAAELRPKKVKSLVYLTAFLLPNGVSFFDAVQGVEGSKAVENFYLSDDKTYAMVKEEEIQNAFAHDIPKEAFDKAKPYIVPEPANPLTYKVEITDAAFGSVPKYYIECTEDRAIPIGIQRAMYKGKVLKSYTIKSSHTPNFSQPQKVAEALLDVAKEQGRLSLVQDYFKNSNSFKIHRLFSNKGQTLAHVEKTEGGKTYADMVLFEGGIDGTTYAVSQEVPEKQVGGLTMFDGVKTAEIDDQNARENMALINKFLKDVWIGGNVKIINDFFHDGKVIQHNPSVENNVEGLFGFLKYITEQGITLQYEEVLATFNVGDIAMTFSKGKFAGEDYLFADLFRLERNKIVEHWDVIQKK